MQVKTVLNRVHPIKGFVYQKVRFVEDMIEVEIRSRKRSRAYCSSCGRRGPTYDHLPARRFAFVPLWGISLFLIYALRRVNCPRCGGTGELVPWGEGKRPPPGPCVVYWWIGLARRWPRSAAASTRSLT